MGLHNWRGTTLVCLIYNCNIKLRSNPEDEIAYTALLKPPDDRVIKPNKTYNYEYFMERIRTANVKADALYTALDKLMIIDITVHPPMDDAQLIFERTAILQSGIRMNQIIAQEDHWGEEQLSRREKRLIAQALQTVPCEAAYARLLSRHGTIMPQSRIIRN
ncbi:hypothetical protein AGMMS49992_25390 [Clostridia bacterium]|nr:hypothetical protein AGMMS49992_25390 [Clostridia bacterium]